MKKTILSLVAASFLALNLSAQEVIPCGTDEALEHVHSEFPELKAEYELRQLLNNSQVVNTTKSGEKATTYVIPVVFHILHTYGSENVSDQLVYDQMIRLNEDYSASNSDTNQVISEFKSIIGDAQIEFRLAALDPNGNCTNGIEHVYSHETHVGDMYSKLEQWNRAHYMNIWVVKTPNSGGTTVGTLLGYATFPSSTEGLGYWYDGIVLRDWTVSGSDRTLTHEAGHWMSLPHTFGSTGANDGTCGDDGILDTPPTDGSFSTCDPTLAECDTLVIENIQNYMDYSSCIHMFTEGQVNVMHNTLLGITGQRDRLWNDTTLMTTGVKDLQMPQDPSNPLTVPLCTPIVDFTSNTNFVCANSPVSFTDASYNAVIDSWEWSFQDGSPATSNSQNPTVSFTSEGYKEVTLTVTNAAGSATETRTSMIFVSADWADFNGPQSLNLENDYKYWFKTNNPENNYGEFKLSEGTGYGNSTAYKLGNYQNTQGAEYATNSYFYNDRLGGSVDELITPSFNLSNTSNIQVSFKYSYATNATDMDDITEELKVYSSRDCGKTWTPRKTIINGALITAGYAGNADFEPNTDGDYVEASFNYTATSQDTKTRFKFVFTASDLSSNLYIDDINVSGTLSLTSDDISELDLNVHPNPVANGQDLNVTYQAQDQPVTFILRDTHGKTISVNTVEATYTTVNHTLTNTTNLSSGCYFLEVSTGGHTTVKKVVVM